MSQISTVLVPALVIKLNNTQYINGDFIVGKTMDVPCREDFIDDVNYWAVPVKDEGIFTGLEMIPKEDNDGVAVPIPTYDSITVFRVRDKLSGTSWWVYGSKADFLTSCSTCCGDTVTPMPTTVPIQIAPCQTLCPNNEGDIVGYFGLPKLQAGEKYFPKGARNNVAYPAASVGGYANVAALLVFLNANYTPYVWTASVDELTLFATGGEQLDDLCISVVAIT